MPADSGLRMLHCVWRGFGVFCYYFLKMRQGSSLTLFLSHVLLLTVQRKLGSPSAALKLIPSLKPIHLLLAGIEVVLSFL